MRQGAAPGGAPSPASYGFSEANACWAAAVIAVCSAAVSVPQASVLGGAGSPAGGVAGNRVGWNSTASACR